MPLVISSMERLTDLIGKAEPLLQASLPPANPLAEASEPFLAPPPVIAEEAAPVSAKP